MLGRRRGLGVETFGGGMWGGDVMGGEDLTEILKIWLRLLSYEEKEILKFNVFTFWLSEG